MIETDIWSSLSREVARLHSEISFGRLTVLLLLLGLAAGTGAMSRILARWLREVGLDRHRRLATFGTLLQATFSALALWWVVSHGLRVAPGVTLLLVLVLTPTFGFLLRGPLLNLLSGFALLLRQTIREGDDIAIEGAQGGRVRQVRLMSTRVLTEDRSELIVPNAMLISRLVIKRPQERGVPLRMQLPFAVRPQQRELERAKRLLLLSPFRAAGSPVSVNIDEAGTSLMMTLRVVSESAKGSASRELSLKIPEALGWNSQE